MSSVRDIPDDPEHAVVVFRGTSGKDEWIDNAIGLGVSDTERQKAALDYIENLPYDSITVAYTLRRGREYCPDSGDAGRFDGISSRIYNIYHKCDARR